MVRLIGMSPLFIGLTLVAFGTSAPELAVSSRSPLIAPLTSMLLVGALPATMLLLTIELAREYSPLQAGR